MASKSGVWHLCNCATPTIQQHLPRWQARQGVHFSRRRQGSDTMQAGPGMPLPATPRSVSREITERGACSSGSRARRLLVKGALNAGHTLLAVSRSLTCPRARCHSAGLQ